MIHPARQLAGGALLGIALCALLAALGQLASGELVAAAWNGLGGAGCVALSRRIMGL